MKGNQKGNSGNSDHRSPDNINHKNQEEAMQQATGDDNGTKAEFQSGDRRPATNEGDNKQGRQGGGPGERQSLAGEAGYKAEDNAHTIQKGSHTSAGEVRGAGSLKDGSSKDQDHRFGFRGGDDMEESPGDRHDVGPGQVTGSANRGKDDGRGGGKSSGAQGHGPQDEKE